MPYAISTALAIYFVIWWTVLFVTLPFGIRSQREAGEEIAGTDPGAPSVPGLGRKMIWTTIISAIVYGVMVVLYAQGFLSIERLTKMLGVPF
jgi:predicted secreted protein